ncbi:pentatricopeptide repeat-containing protein [Pyrus ussuriensis x Pyrus communis]|uniref:Pentatricopeptide repeat-containing protein n=1 Tax=Pyrus ussuriensis x Pyrus communis TaxID=2448454 RepID=A0A5N5IGS2_9ROSA|nr:pentatricopeptide repeat-containing protein [Pyrus ussuriensis x Pyrus communis]
MLISGYTRHGAWRIVSDNLLLLSVATACAALGDVRNAKELHDDAIRFRFHTDVSLCNAMVDMFGKCKYVDGARWVIDAMAVKDVVSWTSLCSCYVNCEMPRQGLEVFREMGLNGMRPIVVTVSSILCACSALKDLNLGSLIHGFVVRHGMEETVSSALVNIYASCRSIKQAQLVFDMMSKQEVVSWNVLLTAYFSNRDCEKGVTLFYRMRREVVKLDGTSWNAVIGGCLNNGQTEQALKMLRQMKESGIKPNQITITSLLPACKDLESLRAGKEVHSYIFRNCLMEDLATTTALVFMYPKCGELELSQRVFDMMPRRDTVAWNTMIITNSMHGNGEEALLLFRKMLDSGVKPPILLLSLVFCAVVAILGLVGEGILVFYSMRRDHSIEPDADHYSCLVDVLSHVGRLVEAYQFVQRMPMEPTPGAWGALFGACRVHKNVGFIEPDNPGNYVLLSNILVTAKRWEEASETRKLMRDRGITKTPGCSLVQLKNSLFFLIDMGEKMRLVGYVPNTDFVLQDVDQEEKVGILCSHSEKLAVAFGILNLNGESTIQVLENEVAKCIYSSPRALIKGSHQALSMAVLVNSVSPVAHPSSETTRKTCGFFSHIRNLQPLSLSKGFSRVLAASQITISPKDTVFALPNWRHAKNDRRSKELRLIDAFVHFESMVGKGQKPDVAQATQLLYDLCKVNKMRKAVRVIEMMVLSGIIPDAASYTFLVNYLCKRGNIGYAMQLVEKMEEYGYPTNTVTYNSLVRGLCVRGNLNQSLQLLDRLIQKGLVPNVYTYSFLLEAAYKERGVNEAMTLLQEIIAKGGKPNVVSYNVLLTGLCKEGRTDEAFRLFRSLPSMGFDPNVVSYNIVLRSLCHEGRWEEANVLLSEMEGEDRAPSIVTYNILIGSLSLHGRTEHALQVLDEMQRGRFKPTAASYNPIIAHLCKEGKVDGAVKCLDQMVHRRCNPNEGTFNAIAVLCEEGLVPEAFSIIQSLCNKQKCSSYELYKNVITSLCRKGNTFPAFQLLYEMTKHGFTPDSYTYSSLIRGLCLEGMLDEAMEIFKVMEENSLRPDTDNFNALILGFCKSRRTDLSFQVFEMMIEKGRMPNEMTYTILVEGIAHEGELELAARVLKELHLRHVVSPNTVERLVMQYDFEDLPG